MIWVFLKAVEVLVNAQEIVICIKKTLLHF